MGRNVGRSRWVAVLVLTPVIWVTSGAALVAQQPARTERVAPSAAPAPSSDGQPARRAGGPDAAPARGAPRANQGARPSGTQPPPRSPQGSYDVVEWVVLVCDPNQPAANGERMFQSTLPEFAAPRRAAAPADSAGQPSPAGVIRVLAGGGAGQGSAAEGTRVDVLLHTSAGRFLGTWPKGKGRSDRQLWEGYELTGESPVLKELPPGHWFAALRDAPSFVLRRGRVAEKFLSYDVELNYALPLRAAGGEKGTYALSNSGASALHDVTLFKPQEGKWRTGWMATLPAANVAMPATIPARLDDQSTELPPGIPPEIAARLIQRRGGAGARGGGAGPPTTATAATVPSTTAPSTRPSPGAATAAVVADSPPADAAGALSAWGERLRSAGVVAADVPQILRILETQALDNRRMTVVYRLDAAELDRLLPLEVTPTPRRTVRVGLVVARNIDPAVGGEIDELVAQLASPDWDKREAASKQLAELGAAARPKLNAALQQKDLEVVWRAERILQAMETPPAPGRQPGR